MAKKIIVFISGIILLSAAWTGIISSVEKYQNITQTENLSIKFNLIQSRLERLFGFNASSQGTLKRPAEFKFKFSDPNLNLIESIVSKGMNEEIYLEVKKTYLDAGSGVLFYILNLNGKGQYLVRAIKSGEVVETVGFELDAVLNYLSQGLEKNEWFLVDSKQRVVASNEKSYVGAPYGVRKAFEKFEFRVSGKIYNFSVLKPKGINLALANVMGILGIGLILCAVYIYTETNSGESRQEEAREALVISDTGGVIQTETESNTFEEELSEEVKMVDLTQTKKNEIVKLDYTEFLIENPILGEKPKEELSATSPKEIAVEEKPAEIKKISSDDWVKLAEELSANIDKFTQDLKENKENSGMEV